jgi:hypothetical protein
MPATYQSPVLQNARTALRANAHRRLQMIVSRACLRRFLLVGLSTVLCAATALTRNFPNRQFASTAFQEKSPGLIKLTAIRASRAITVVSVTSCALNARPVFIRSLALPHVNTASPASTPPSVHHRTVKFVLRAQCRLPASLNASLALRDSIQTAMRNLRIRAYLALLARSAPWDRAHAILFVPLERLGLSGARIANLAQLENTH